MRSRPSDSFVAAAASFVSVLGLTTLFVSQEWLGVALWLFLLIAVLGVLLRRLTSRGSLVVLGQAVLLTWTIVAVFAHDTLSYGLPTWDTLSALADLVRDCGAVVQRYAAPVPMTPGVQFCVVVGVCLVALVVDYAAVTRSAPAAAGLPLLTAFLAAAANSGSALAPGYFLVPALAWMAMVARQSRWSMQRWSTTVASPRTPTATVEAESDALGSFGTTARQFGAIALVAAVALPAVLPHLPTRFILDGLGTSDTATGRSDRVGFNSTLDLSRSLKDGSLNPVLTYRPSTPDAPPPLRVVVAADYVSGEWRARPGRANQAAPETTPAGVSPSVTRTVRQLTVENNQLELPHVAAPYPVTAADFGNVPWGVDPTTNDVYVRARASAYKVSYMDVGVTAASLRQGIEGAPTLAKAAADPLMASSMTLDTASAGLVRQLANTVTEKATTPYDAAVAIQDWLRSTGGFTYTLTLPEAKDAAGNPVRLDPLSSFLTTKQGYCVQFATAMVMMARAKGIPARMAIGFLPGTADQGTWTVRAADAHSWPELYFPGAGWLRFEPTPSVRTGAPPAYTVAPSNAPVGTTGGREVDENGQPVGAPSVAPRPGVDNDPGVTDPSELPQQSVRDLLVGWFSQGPNLVLLGTVLGLLGTLVLPLTAVLLQRRRRRRAHDDAALAEAQWHDLTSRLTDLGLPPPPGGTPRQWGRHYTRAAFLDDDADLAMRRVVATLERTRYARPGTEPVDLVKQVHQITRAAAGSRSRRLRLRAFFAPGDAVRWWRGLVRRTTSAPQRWVRAVLGRRPRRAARSRPPRGRSGS